MNEQISYSSAVKSELASDGLRQSLAQKAEIAVYIHYFGHINSSSDGYNIFFETENKYAAKRYALLLKKYFGFSPEVGFMQFIKSGRLTKSSCLYGVVIRNIHQGLEIVKTLNINPLNGQINPTDKEMRSQTYTRAFIRAAFISAGTMSDPNKSYHMEWSVPDDNISFLLTAMCNSFGIKTALVERKSSRYLYIKEADMISDMLNIMDAHKALLDFENIRILHDIANTINRQNNCDIANSQKTVSASQKQIENIKLIKKYHEFTSLSIGLQKLAEARLNNPDLSLQELGNQFNPPLGKSGVNHRMRKISEIADSLRTQNK